MSGDKEKDGIVIRLMNQDDVERIMTEDRITPSNDRCITFAKPVNVNQLVEETTFGVVAEDTSKNNKICGFVTGVIRKDPENGESAWLHLTGVHPDYRHRGIGTRMADAFFAHCREKGIKSVRINVNWGDASLLTWLGGLGFGMSLGKLVEFERTL